MAQECGTTSIFVLITFFADLFSSFLQLHPSKRKNKILPFSVFYILECARTIYKVIISFLKKKNKNMASLC